MTGRTPPRLRRTALIIEITPLLGLVALTWVWRWQQVKLAVVDPDEVFLLGGVDRMARGLLPYVDHAEAHMPLFSRLLVPLWTAWREHADFLVAFRLLEWLAVGVSQILLGVVAWRFGRWRACAWSLGLLNAFTFYLERTVHVRFEPFAAVLTLAAFAAFSTRKRPGFGIREGVAAVLLGLAAASHVSGPFFVAAFVVSLIVLDGGSNGVRAMRSAFLFGTVAVASWLGVFAIVLGGRLWDGLVALRAGFAFDAIYQAALRSDLTHFLPGILRESPVAAALCIALLVAAHEAVVRQRLRDPAPVLALLLADLSLGIVLARAPDYPQRYLSVAMFGALAAGFEVARRMIVSRDGAFRRVAPAVAMLCALALTGQTLVPLTAEDPAPPAFARGPNDVPVPHLSAEYRVNPDDLLLWWDTGGAAPDAFRSRSRAEYRAVVRFLREHSDPSEHVFTDWMNPPLRELPARHHHGAMIDIFERSGVLAESPGTQAAYRRYNPDYRSFARPEETFAAMFDRTTTKIIALDGSMGRAFRADANFRAWVVERYDLILEPRSEIVFAVRR